MSADYFRATPDARIHRSRTWLAPTLVFGCSALLYLVNLDRLPHPDELYHVLAARGIVDHGEPRIAEGLYTRVLAFTWLVAQLFAWLGESLAVARLPSLVAMAALNVLLFLWLRKEAGGLAAWLATILFATSPFAVETAQFARFYGLQSLTFLAGCLAVYAMAKSLVLDRRLLGLGLIAVLCLAFALYTQPTTFLGLGGLALWLVTVLGAKWLLDRHTPRRRKYQALGLCLIACLALVGLLLATGIGAELWHRYRSAPPFNANHVDDFWYYHVYYVLFYPTLWPVIGLLSFAALAVYPRLAWFAGVIFAVGFLLNSFGGPKNLRYIAYAQPFLFVVFGLGLAAIMPWLTLASNAFKQQIETHLAGIGLAGRRLPELLLWSSLLVVILTNAAFLRTATLLADITVPPQMQPIRWPEALPLVEERLLDADVVVTMAELETLYFWERYDILFSPSRLSEIAGGAEFAADHRTGRPVISTTAALAEVVDCTAKGMFIATAQRWRAPQFIDAETADFIEQEMTRLDLPEALQLIVFVWDHSPDTDCPPAIEQIREARE